MDSLLLLAAAGFTGNVGLMMYAGWLRDPWGGMMAAPLIGVSVGTLALWAMEDGREAA